MKKNRHRVSHAPYILSMSSVNLLYRKPIPRIQTFHFRVVICIWTVIVRLVQFRPPAKECRHIILCNILLVWNYESWWQNVEIAPYKNETRWTRHYAMRKRMSPLKDAIASLRPRINWDHTCARTNTVLSNLKFIRVCGYSHQICISWSFGVNDLKQLQMDVWPPCW